MPRPSNIDLLPAEIRDALHELLRNPAITGTEVAMQVNTWLEALGSDLRVSKSGVNRYGQRMDKVGAKMQQSRQIAEMWIGKLGNAPQGQVGKLLNEFLRTMAFDAALEMSEGETPPAPKMIKDLSLAVKHLEDAASVNEKRDREIRRQANEEAAKIAEKVGTEQGLSTEAVQSIKNKILGIV